jgi:predicted nucleotidyltransferase
MMFGSCVNTRRRKANDIDIAIYFYAVPKGLDLLNLINTSSNLTGKEVDLVVLNTASAFLRHQVMKTGIPLIIKDKDIFQRFREKTITDYDEYKYISGMNIYD